MSWKDLLLSLLGKDAEAVVVTFLSGPEPLARKMLEEVKSLVPEREHFAVFNGEPFAEAGVRMVPVDELPGPLRRKRIGLAPFLLNVNPRYRRLRRAAFATAPRKLLAYNERLERHHLRLSTPIASLLFLARRAARSDLAAAAMAVSVAVGQDGFAVHLPGAGGTASNAGTPSCRGAITVFSVSSEPRRRGANFQFIA